jgi:carboxypeptidase T
VVHEHVLAELRAAHVPFTVIVDDIDAVARAEHERLHGASQISSLAQPADWFADYRDYRAITERIQSLAASHPERARVQPIGSSFEGRTLWAIRIGGTAADATPMLINGAQHAREWISPMVATCIADRLVREYPTDPAIRDFVDHTALWVVPVVNPDGYQYTWSGNRYWRKNRRGSHGVDLNRNWDIAWGGDGSSGNRFSDVYRGERPFSEPETAALRDLALREHIALHVDVHSFSQLLLYPWGYTATPAPDAARFAAVGDRLASAIQAAHGVPYKLMSSVQLYAASGTMTDWMYGKAKAMSYTIELRPGRGGRSGFVLPPEQIRPTCDEAMAAVLELRRATR